MTTEILVALLSITTAIIIYLKWSFGYWSRKGIPTPPTNFPFGNVADMFWQKNMLAKIIKDAYETLKPNHLKYCGFYFFTKPTLVLFDLDLVKSVLVKDFAYFSGHGMYVNEKIDPLTGNLVFLEGKAWRNMRTKLTPTFTSGKMKMMFQTLVACCDGLIKVIDQTIKKQETVDIKDLLGRYTTDVIGSCAFGVECNSLENPNSEFVMYGRKALFRKPLQSFKILMSMCVPKLLKYFNVSLFERDVIDFFATFVKETVNYREKNHVVRKDFMHLLIELKNQVINDHDDDDDYYDEVNRIKTSKVASAQSELKNSFTVEEIVAQAFIFFLAGFETTSTTLTFCLYELASNLEIQDKLRAEVNSTLHNYNGELTYDALTQMTYMDKCINETLRKHPPIPLIFRECNEAYSLPNSDLVVEKGTKVFIPILAIHHDPEYYPDPEKFDPERFAAEAKSARQHFAWLGFGEGPRSCIGLRFALMQTKACLAMLLKDYKFLLSSNTQTPLPIDPKPFALVALGEVWLDVEKVL